MPSETSYPGIYRGYVIDTNDPKNAGRIRLVVPQVLGEEITTWAWPILGLASNYKVPYGSWTSSVTQTASTTSVNYAIAMDGDEGSYGISLVNPSTSTSGPYTSYLFFKYSGTYNIQLSAQLYSTVGGNSIADADIWMQINGTDVSSSVGSISVSAKNPFAIGSWNYIVKVNAGDKISFIWNANHAAPAYLQAAAAQAGPPPQPSTPSFTVSAQLVGSFIPNAADPCWVMFEGGDPNFPLWLGTF